MESTNSRQAAFVVNRKAVESTNDIQNITFGLKLTKEMKSVMPLMRVLLYGSSVYYEHLESLRKRMVYEVFNTSV